MSEKRVKATTSSIRQTHDLDAWREEVETFCRQTVTRIHEIIDANADDDRTTSETVLPDTDIARVTRTDETPRRAVEAARTTVDPLTAPIAAAARDLDSSQDRLANLKRELAAKLSNTARNGKVNPAAGTS